MEEFRRLKLRGSGNIGRGLFSRLQIDKNPEATFLGARRCDLHDMLGSKH